MADELLTASELAHRLRVKPGTVRTWARQGRIPAVRITAKVVRYDFSEVVKSLQHRDGEVRDEA